MRSGYYRPLVSYFLAMLHSMKYLSGLHAASGIASGMAVLL